MASNSAAASNGDGGGGGDNGQPSRNWRGFLAGEAAFVAVMAPVWQTIAAAFRDVILPHVTKYEADWTDFWPPIAEAVAEKHPHIPAAVFDHEDPENAYYLNLSNVFLQFVSVFRDMLVEFPPEYPANKFINPRLPAVSHWADFKIFYELFTTDYFLRLAGTSEDLIRDLGSLKTHALAHRIAHVVKGAFDRAIDDSSRWKIASAFVLTSDLDPDWIRIASIGTGTKVITREAFDRSLKHEVVFDSHAEIIARRAFLRLLYDQMSEVVNGRARDELCIEQRVDGNGFRLKPWIHVHLFINSTPCGDARLPLTCHSSLRDKVPRGILTAKDFQTDVKEGKLDMGIEAGVGNDMDLIMRAQCLDGVKKFQSCSDKVCLWNAVGIQGSLLANLMEPVFLYSITVDEYFDAVEMRRALWTRLGSLPKKETLPGRREPFLLQSPIEVQSAKVSSKRLANGKPDLPAYSGNWCESDRFNSREAEWINGQTGRVVGVDTEGPSRISKHGLFAAWLAVVRAGANPLPNSLLARRPRGFLRSEHIYTGLSYQRDVKLAAKEYQDAKRAAKAAFPKSPAGWHVHNDIEFKVAKPKPPTSPPEPILPVETLDVQVPCDQFILPSTSATAINHNQQNLNPNKKRPLTPPETVEVNSDDEVDVEYQSYAQNIFGTLGMEPAAGINGHASNKRHKGPFGEVVDLD